MHIATRGVRDRNIVLSAQRHKREMSRVEPARGSKADELEGTIAFNIPLRERVAAIAGGADIREGTVDAVGDVEEFIVGLCAGLLVYV